MQAKILIIGAGGTEKGHVAWMLGAAGRYAVEEAADVQTAMNLLDPVPDLILLDDQSGAEGIPRLYENVRSRTVLMETPVLILTSPLASKGLERLIDPGICDFLCKPILAVELAARVRSLLHIKSLADEVKKERTLLDAMSITDALTGLANERYLLKRLDEEILRCQRFNLSLSCLMIRIDGLERLETRHGGEVHDRVIRHVANLMDHLLRRIDLVSRYSETLFCALLPATGLYNAGLAAEKLRLGVEKSLLKIDGADLRCTVSAGLATFPDCGGTAEEILRAASAALNRTASTGENGIAVAPVTGPGNPA